MASKGKPKRASPKEKKTAELYRSSHNIGSRAARMRVGCYKDTEYTVEYPAGFWDPVKPDQSPPPPANRSSPAKGKPAAASTDNASPSRSPAKNSLPQKAGKTATASGAVKRKAEDKELAATNSSPKKSAKVSNSSPNQTSSANKPSKDNKEKLKKKEDKPQKKEDKKKKKLEKVKELKKLKKLSKKEVKKEKRGFNKGKGKTGDNNKKAKKAEFSKPTQESGKKRKESTSEVSSTTRDSDYTYDSEDSDMEISFRKKKAEKNDAKAKKSSANKTIKKVISKKKPIKSKKAKKAVIQPRAPRIKRTACLNANAIVSALYQTDDSHSHSHSNASSGGGSATTTKNTTTSSTSSAQPASPTPKQSPPKRKKTVIEADADDGGDEAFDLYLEEYQQMGRDKSPAKLSKKATSKKESINSPKEVVNHNTPNASPKKASTQGKVDSPKKEFFKKDTPKSSDSAKKDNFSSKVNSTVQAKSSLKVDCSPGKQSGSGHEYDFESDDEVIIPKFKSKINRDKSPKKEEARKSAKEDKKSTANSVSQKKDIPAAKVTKKKVVIKKDESSSDEFDSSSESEVEDIPLWPPPKRMASLNASAMMAASASTDRNVRKSIDKSPSRPGDEKPKETEKTKSETDKSKPKDKDKKVTENCHGASKADKLGDKSDKGAKKGDGKSEGRAEAKVSPMRSAVNKPTSNHTDNNRSATDHHSPSKTTSQRGPGHWVQGMVGSPTKQGHPDGLMKSPVKSPGQNAVGSRPGSVSMNSVSSDIQMVPSSQMSYSTGHRYPPMPAGSPEVQVVEVQRTGYWNGYPRHHSGYDRPHPGSGYHQGLPPPAHHYPGAGAGPPRPYQQHSYPPSQHQPYPGQSSSQGSSHSGPSQPTLYPMPSSQHHSGYPNAKHMPPSRPQHGGAPPPAHQHQHRQHSPYLDPQQQSSQPYGALHSMQQRYGSPPAPQGHDKQNKLSMTAPRPSQGMPRYAPPGPGGPQISPGQNSQQMSPGSHHGSLPQQSMDNSSYQQSSSASSSTGSSSSSGAPGGSAGKTTDGTNDSSAGINHNGLPDATSGGSGGNGATHSVNDYVHRTSPMGITTTYPYPHSNSHPPGPPAQYPYSSGTMSSMSSYRMMLGRAPFNTSAFTSPGYHQTYGMTSNDMEMSSDRGVASPFDLTGGGDQGALSNAL